MSRFFRKITAASFFVLLAACGGGGGDDDAATDSNNGVPRDTSGNDAGSGSGTGGDSSTGGTGSTGSGGGNAPAPDESDGNSGSPPATPAYAYDTTARFNTPTDLHLDDAGNLLVLDTGNQSIRRVAASGDVSTLDGRELSLDMDAAGNIFHFVRNDVEDPLERDSTDLIRISPDGTRKTIVRYIDMPGSVSPLDVQTDGQGQLYVLTRYRTQFWINKIDPDNPPESVSFGDSTPGRVYHLSTYGGLSNFSVDPQGNVAVTRYEPDDNENIITFIPVSAQPAEGSSAGTASYTAPGTVTYGKDGKLYVFSVQREPADSGDTDSPWIFSNMKISTMSPDGSMTTVLNGFPDGRDSSIGSEGRLSFGLEADTSGNVYFSDSAEHAIYKISPGGQGSLFAGKPEEAGSSD